MLTAWRLGIWESSSRQFISGTRYKLGQLKLEDSFPRWFLHSVSCASMLLGLFLYMAPHILGPLQWLNLPKWCQHSYLMVVRWLIPRLPSPKAILDPHFKPSIWPLFKVSEHPFSQFLLIKQDSKANPESKGGESKISSLLEEGQRICSHLESAIEAVVSIFLFFLGLAGSHWRL